MKTVSRVVFQHASSERKTAPAAGSCAWLCECGNVLLLPSIIINDQPLLRNYWKIFPGRKYEKLVSLRRRHCVARRPGPPWRLRRAACLFITALAGLGLLCQLGTNCKHSYGNMLSWPRTTSLRWLMARKILIEETRTLKTHEIFSSLNHETLTHS